MHKPAVLASLSLYLVACATPPPQVPDETAAAHPPADARSGAATPADAGSNDSVIEVLDVPKPVAVADVPQLQTRDGRVCHRERRTGSNRVVRVCRTRAEIERDALESKEMFDEIRRSQQEYDR